MSKEKAPVKSVSYGGDVTFAQSDRRNYFFICAIDDLDITFGGGGGLIPIAAGGYFEPRVMPTCQFKVYTEGVFVFMSDDHTQVTE